jgi:hypothetical protein
MEFVALLPGMTSPECVLAADGLDDGGRDLEPLGRPPQRPPIVNDTTRLAQTPGLAQRGITVNQEGLRSVL